MGNMVSWCIAGCKGGPVLRVYVGYTLFDKGKGGTLMCHKLCAYATL